MSKLLNPDLNKLSAEQQKCFKHYDDLRNFVKLSRTPNEKTFELKQSIHKFFLSLTKEQQYIHSNWYRYEMCDIDPTMIACVEMAEFINGHGLEKQFALSEDGKSFLFIGKDQDAINLISNSLEQKYKGIKYEIIEVNNE